jgi:hypothetical protein
MFNPKHNLETVYIWEAKEFKKIWEIINIVENQEHGEIH